MERTEDELWCQPILGMWYTKTKKQVLDNILDYLPELKIVEHQYTWCANVFITNNVSVYTQQCNNTD